MIPVLTDLHFGARGDSEHIQYFQKQFFEQVFWPEVDAHPGVTDILCLGDVLDRRKYVNFNTLKFAKQMFFIPAQKRGLRVHWLIGNHDMYFKHTMSLTCVRAFKEFDNIIPYYGPTVVEFEGEQTLMLPWVCKANEAQTIEMVKTFPGSTVAGHLELMGFEMHRGLMCSSGTFKADDLWRFPLVMSGHFHWPSQQENIQYLGSPYEMAWSDVGAPRRGFSWWSPTDRTLTHVNNPYQLFVKVGYNDTDKPSNYVKDILTLLTDLPDIHHRIIRVIVKAKTNPTLFQSLMDGLTALQANEVQYVDISDRDNPEMDDRPVLDVKTDSVAFIKQYVESCAWPTPDAQQQALNLMVELYQEALVAR